MDTTRRAVLETSEERLWIGDQPVQLNRVSFRLLRVFAESEGKLVSRRKILRDVWPDTNVSDASVKDSVKNLRATLGDNATRPVFIETVRGRGYRFLGGIDVVERVATGTTTTADQTADTDVPHTNPIPPAAPSRSFAMRWQLLVAGIAVVGFAMFFSFVWRSSDDPVPARPDRMALSIPDKPSIAVTPFVNASGQTDDDWLSVGLSTSVITALATSPDMVVISQNALDDMSGVKPGEIAERYGVQYVLDGTIQVDDDKLRITARLADAIAGRTMWSEKWNRDLDDIFQIQDEIADAILEELQVRLTIGEQARAWRTSTGSPENMRALIVGRGAFQTFTPEGHVQAARLWDAMYERDPDLPMAIGLQGWLAWHRVVVGISTDPVADLNAAKEWGQRAIDAGLGGNNHVLYATAASYLGQSKLAVDYAEQGVLTAPGEADVVMIAGSVLSENGRLEKGIHLMQRGMRLEPDYPGWLAGAMTRALVKADRWPEAQDLAIEILDKNIPDTRARFSAVISLVVLSVWQQKPTETRHHLAALLELRPGITVAQMATNPRYLNFTSLVEDPDFRNRYLAALRTAGLPEGE